MYSIYRFGQRNFLLQLLGSDFRSYQALPHDFPFKAVFLVEVHNAVFCAVSDGSHSDLIKISAQSTRRIYPVVNPREKHSLFDWPVKTV